MTDLQMLGNSFLFFNLAWYPWYRRTKDLVPLFDLRVHLFEYSVHLKRLWPSCKEEEGKRKNASFLGGESILYS